MTRRRTSTPEYSRIPLASWGRKRRLVRGGGLGLGDRAGGRGGGAAAAGGEAAVVAGEAVGEIDGDDREQDQDHRDGGDDGELFGAEEVAGDPDRQGFFARADGEGGDGDIVEGEGEGEQGAGAEGAAQTREGDPAEGLPGARAEVGARFLEAPRGAP